MSDLLTVLGGLPIGDRAEQQAAVASVFEATVRLHVALRASYKAADGHISATYRRVVLVATLNDLEAARVNFLRAKRALAVIMPDLGGLGGLMDESHHSAGEVAEVLARLIAEINADTPKQ